MDFLKSGEEDESDGEEETTHLMHDRCKHPHPGQTTQGTPHGPAIE